MSGQMSRETLLLLCLCFCAACGQQPPRPESPAATPGPAQWIGKWFGPEGTFVEIAKDAEQYRIIIRNLDEDCLVVKPGEGYCRG